MTVVPAQSLIDGEEILLVLENYAAAIEGGTVEASSTADGTGDPRIDMTAEKMLIPDLDTAWRSGSLASLSDVVVTIDLGAARLVDWVSIHRHNVRCPWRVVVRSQAGGSVRFDSGWREPVVRAALGDFGWYDLLWTLGPTNKTLNGLAADYRLDAFVEIPTPVLCRVVEIYFDVSAGNKVADDLTIGYAMVSKAFRPSINMTLGWSIRPVDRTETRRTESGAKRGRQRTRGKILSFSLEYVEQKESIEDVLKAVTKIGVLGVIFVVPLPRQRRYFYETAILGQFEGELPESVVARHDWAAARAFVVEEAE